MLTYKPYAFRGYAEKEGDARNFHPKLRPPVSSRELEIDSNTGMKVRQLTTNTRPSFTVDHRNILLQKDRDGTHLLLSSVELSAPVLRPDAVQMEEKARSFGRHTASSALVSIRWKICLLTVIGVRSLFANLGTGMYSAMWETEVKPTLCFLIIDFT